MCHLINLSFVFENNYGNLKVMDHYIGRCQDGVIPIDPFLVKAICRSLVTVWYLRHD